MCVCTISCLLAAAKSCNLQFDSNPQHMVEAGKFKLPWFDLFDDLVKEHICIFLTTKKALSSWWSYTLKRRDKRGDSVHLAVDVQYLDLVSGLVIIWKQNLKIRTYITSENEYKKIKVATCHRLSIFLKFSINYLYHPDTAPTHASHLIWSHINKRLNVTWVTFEFRLLYLVHKYSKASFNTDIYCWLLRLVLTLMLTPRDGVPVTRSIGALCISGPCHDQYWHTGSLPVHASYQCSSALPTIPTQAPVNPSELWVAAQQRQLLYNFMTSFLFCRYVMWWLGSKKWHVDTFDLGIFRFVHFPRSGLYFRLDKDAQTSKSFAACKQFLISHNKVV